jgi:hypothetical protein
MSGSPDAAFRRHAKPSLLGVWPLLRVSRRLFFKSQNMSVSIWSATTTTARAAFFPDTILQSVRIEEIGSLQGKLSSSATWSQSSRRWSGLSRSMEAKLSFSTTTSVSRLMSNTIIVVLPLQTG